jgi:ABC-2 type transport system ATP-binding protein
MQDGKIMKIEKPARVTAEYPFHLYSVSSSDIYKLQSDLKEWPEAHSVHAFGQSAHLASQKEVIDRPGLIDFLQSKGHGNITLEDIEPSIEDCFMELMSTPPLLEERGPGGEADAERNL